MDKEFVKILIHGQVQVREAQVPSINPPRLDPTRSEIESLTRSEIIFEWE